MKPAIAKSMVLITIIFLDLLTGIEFDIFLPSFPELQVQFNLSPFWVESLLSINLLGYCLSLFFVGNLADRYGRRPLIVIGLIVFVLGSIFCLWVPYYPFLFIGRFLQGAGIAAPAILSILIIADTYPLKKQLYLMALLNGVTNTAVAIAPIAGSFLTLYFHWEGNFITLLLLGTVALVMVLLFIPRYALPVPQEPVLLKGYLPLFKSKSLILLMVCIIFMFVPYWIFAGISPLLYIQALGVSLEHFGYYQGVLALVFAMGSFTFGFFVNRYDQKKMLFISSLLSIASLMSLGFVTLIDSTTPLWITLAFLVFIISQVIPSTILYPLCLNFMPEAKGRVSAVLQGTRLIFSAISLQLAGYFYQGSFQNIGIIITITILIAVITLFFVIKNRKIMSFLDK